MKKNLLVIFFPRSSSHKDEIVLFLSILLNKKMHALKEIYYLDGFCVVHSAQQFTSVTLASMQTHRHRQ